MARVLAAPGLPLVRPHHQNALAAAAAAAAASARTQLAQPACDASPRACRRRNYCGHARRAYDAPEDRRSDDERKSSAD